MPQESCKLREHELGRGYRAVTLENRFLSATVLPDKGADIYSLVYKPRKMDVLWKSPWGLKNLRNSLSSAGAQTEAAWLDHYEGGWQEIFPNGGDACTYKGAPLNFHGEASALPWDYTVLTRKSTQVTVEFTVRLFRSPFLLRRRVTIEKNLPALLLSEKLTSETDEEMHFMWGHHPAYGDPFLGGRCRIEVPAKTYRSHDVPIAPTLRVPAGTSGPWPILPGKNGKEVDLSVIPGSNERWVEFGYLCDLEDGWYGLVSGAHGFGVGLAWPKKVFRYLWMWQELRGSFGYPWYGRCYVMAIEPFTSIPGTGLVKAIEKATAPVLKPGETLEVDLAAAFFEDRGKIKSISPSGIVQYQ